MPKNNTTTLNTFRQKRFSFLKTFPNVAVWTGLEPATPCVTGMYSNQLNYQTIADRLHSSIFIASVNFFASANILHKITFTNLN